MATKHGLSPKSPKSQSKVQFIDNVPGNWCKCCVCHTGKNNHSAGFHFLLFLQYCLLWHKYRILASAVKIWWKMVPQKMGDRATKDMDCMPVSHARQQIRLGKKILSSI